MTQNGAGAVAEILKAAAKAMEGQFPSIQEEQGDDKLNQARDLVTREVKAMIEENDLRVIEEKISYAWEVKVGLSTKSGFRKFRHARKYHDLANGVYRDAKLISDRAHDLFQFQSQSGTSSDADHIYAQSLYRCLLSCKDAFPSLFKQEDWVKEVRDAACHRTDARPNLSRQDETDEEFKCSSMKLLNDMKMKTKSAVESSYEFDTGQAAQSISHNASRAQALLAQKTFIYREFNFGGRPRYPYRHPIIQKVVNITWFQNKGDIGIIFHDYFAPIPFEAIALVVTVIECCIDEWSTGTWKESSWEEMDYKTHYNSHLNSLRDLHYCGLQKDLVRRIQDDLLKAARIHAGAPPDPTTWAGGLSRDAIEAAVQDEPPKDSD